MAICVSDTHKSAQERMEYNVDFQVYFRTF